MKIHATVSAWSSPVPVRSTVLLLAAVLPLEGGDVAAVSKLMGHASVKMTVDQYYHLLGDAKRRTIAKLPSRSRPDETPPLEAAPSDTHPPTSVPA